MKHVYTRGDATRRDSRESIEGKPAWPGDFSEVLRPRGFGAPAAARAAARDASGSQRSRLLTLFIPKSRAGQFSVSDTRQGGSLSRAGELPQAAGTARDPQLQHCGTKPTHAGTAPERWRWRWGRGGEHPHSHGSVLTRCCQGGPLNPACSPTCLLSLNEAQLLEMVSLTPVARGWTKC